MPAVNYTPIIVVDTTNMDESTWHSYRRKGIGGSDVAAVYGQSPFCTTRDLYYTKIGIKPVIEEEENWVAKKYGHLLEDTVNDGKDENECFVRLIKPFMRTVIRDFPLLHSKPRMKRFPVRLAVPFTTMYGEQKWGVSMYDGCTGLIENYINPLIGDLKIQSITTRTTDKFVQTLQKTPAVGTPLKPNKEGKMVTDKTIEKIIKLMRCAFGQAVRWELLSKNPFEHTLCPKTTYNKRDIWDAETIMRALNECDDSKLYIAMNLSFACSLRIGEILGLTWDNVHITDEDISNDNAWVYVDKELERVSMRALKALGEKSIIKVFTPLMPNTSTRVVLKTPKTESSVRKVWLPKTLAYILREWQTAQTELKEYLGDEYQDDNLVIALPNGRPCENRIIAKEFEKLKEKANLPNVVFHSLRHSSTTYKLKLNHGDLKATQGDTGHAQLDMITDIYAHILDEDRKVNAQKFEAAFYGTRDLRDVKPPEEPKQQTVDLTALIEQLQKNPELASTLAALIANGSNASC